MPSGSTNRQIINAIAGAITGNATGSLGALAQSALGNLVESELSAQIGNIAGATDSPASDGSILNVLLHTIDGCLGATIGGANCASTALATGAAAASANLFPTETSTNIPSIQNLVETLVGALGLASGGASSSLAQIITAAQSTVENNETGAISLCSSPGHTCNVPALTKNELIALGVIFGGGIIIGGITIATGGLDLAAAGSLAPLYSAWGISTVGNSVVNITTNATMEDVEAALLENGFTESVSRDGLVQIFTDGVTKYTVRSFSNSGPPTMEVFSPGNPVIKIRLAGP